MSRLATSSRVRPASTQPAGDGAGGANSLGENVQHPSSEPAWPLDADALPWIATGPGKSFRPLRFGANGWSELMRLEPGSGVPLHRHTGDVHAFNLSGTRKIYGTSELVGAGCYVYE